MRAVGWFLAGVAAAAVLLELVLRVLPTSTSTEMGYHVDPLIVTYPPGHSFTQSGGWNFEHAARHVANNAGFIAGRDFVPDQRSVALIGDSFVEATTLPAHDRLAAQLEGLAKRPVYAFGGPGSSLLDYAERMRFASERYGTTDFVLLLERGDARQAVCGSGNVHGPCLDARTLAPTVQKHPEATLAKRVLRRSALAQYVFSQLMVDPMAMLARLQRTTSDMSGNARATTAPKTGADQETKVVDAVAADFFARTSRLPPHRLILVFDCDRTRLARGEPASDPQRDRLMALARARGAQVVDTEPLFREFLKKTGLRLEVSPRDAHWNREAHRIAAEAVAPLLETR